jgi:hypothetical protein
MEIVLNRRYYPEGTNGSFYYAGHHVCESIELAWNGNQRQKSCIPEGRYRLCTLYSPGKGKRLLVTGVPVRDGILIHCANNALDELKGCIAPVTKTIAPGKGLYSRIALERLEDLVIPVIEAREEVWLVVASPQPLSEREGLVKNANNF